MWLGFRFWPSRWLLMLTGVVTLWIGLANPVQASTERLGLHILFFDDLSKVNQLLKTEPTTDNWRYITIPFTVQDTKRLGEWQRFFDQAKQQRIIPILRLATRFENGAWQIPTRKDIVTLETALSSLQWPTSERYIIVFNEVNHAKEWGGRLDPQGYAQILVFTSAWFKASSYTYRVLPAAMDLAAPDGKTTRSALGYLDQVLATEPQAFAQLDYWNSHSYPNPGFSAPPDKRGLNSLWGFAHELAYVEQKTGRKLEVFITETGWASNTKTRKWLGTYYAYALQHIWSDPRVKAVTPFVLKGDPGPFAEFGFLDRNDQPTVQYQALQEAITKVQNTR